MTLVGGAFLEVLEGRGSSFKRHEYVRFLVMIYCEEEKNQLLFVVHPIYKINATPILFVVALSCQVVSKQLIVFSLFFGHTLKHTGYLALPD